MRLTRVERAVAAGFRAGTRVDLGDRRDRRVRAEALRFILLDGIAARPGERAELELANASVVGAFELESVDVDVPITFLRCVFDAPVSFFGSRLRRLAFFDCRLDRLKLSNATVDGNLALSGSTCAGVVALGGATIGGSLLLSRAELTGPGICLDATSMRIRRDVIAEHGFTCRGAIRLDRSEVGGVLSLEGAVLEGSGDVVMGEFRAGNDIASGGFDDAEWAQSVAFSGRHLIARELTLLPAAPPGGLVDLRHARVELLRDDPATWPPRMRIDGLRYEAVTGLDDCATRLRWLRLDPPAYRPQPYTQLAQMYRTGGREEDARNVLLAGERRRRETLPWPGRWWGHLQDLTVGYGYRPLRAVLWLALLFVVGTVVFTVRPPRAAEAAKAPELIEPVYVLDLILPVLDFGQQSAYHARGGTAWLAYALIVAGLVLATTVAAAAARRLRRA